MNQPLRLLVENEIFRLAVWANPSNEAKRGSDHVGSSERTMLEVSTCALGDADDDILPNETLLRPLGQTLFVQYGKLIPQSQSSLPSDSKIPPYTTRSASSSVQVPSMSLMFLKHCDFSLEISWTVPFAAISRLVHHYL